MSCTEALSRYKELGHKIKSNFLAKFGTPRQQSLGEFSISTRTLRGNIRKNEILKSHAKKSGI